MLGRWASFIDGRILKMIGPDSVHFDAVAQAFSLLRAELRKEFAAELASLRADMNVQTGIARGEIKTLKAEAPVRKRA